MKPEDTVKVKGRCVRGERDGAVHRVTWKQERQKGEASEMCTGKKPQKSSAARRRTNTFIVYRKKSFNEAYMRHKKEPD